jgi:hypothetical protein
MARIQRAVGWPPLLFSRLVGDPMHKLFRRQRSQLRGSRLPGATNLRLLLRGFLADFRTLTSRMKRRWHAYPRAYAAKLGPIYRRDANGDLQACTLAPLYMRDIEDFEASLPRATVFDLELFYRGWERGAESALCNRDRLRLEEMARNDYAPEHGRQASTE